MRVIANLFAEYIVLNNQDHVIVATKRVGNIVYFPTQQREILVITSHLPRAPILKRPFLANTRFWHC